MKRLTEKTVFCGLVTAWRLATVPTRRSPEGAKATTDGVVRPPSAFSITVGSPPSRTAMHELVVPRSMPMVFAMSGVVLLESRRCEKSASCYSRCLPPPKGPEGERRPSRAADPRHGGPRARVSAGQEPRSPLEEADDGSRTAGTG